VFAASRPADIHKFINLGNLVKRLVYKLVSVYHSPMEGEMKTERITTMMTPSEVQTVDDWAFSNRIRSRGEAIRRLIEMGLSTGKSSAPAGGSNPGGARKPRSSVKSTAPREKRPGRQAEPAQPQSKEAQIRALREQGAS
jgi:hypothetical protein